MPDPKNKMTAAPVAPAQPKDPLVGTMLGEYLVEQVIGSGGMGIVYRGVQQTIDKRVAIKVLQWESARNPEEAQRLVAEARLVNSIRHRGIVDIYAFGETPDGRKYLVMDLLEGDPFDKLIADRAPIASGEALELLDEICDALSAAHGAGVIHRDLKPNNVFLVSPPHGSPYVKLLDFGLAKKSATPGGSAAQTRASIVVGTPYYMAPEQARGQAISPQTDLYALGVMAFEMLTGKLPFDASTPFEVITMHLNNSPPRVCSLEQSVPDALDELIDNLLQKDPSQRPASANDVRREMQRIRNQMHSDATQIPSKGMLDAEPPTHPIQVVAPTLPPRAAIPEPPPLELAAEPAPLVEPPTVDAPLELDNEPRTATPVVRNSAYMRRSRADLPKDLRVSVARRRRNWGPLKLLVALLLLAVAGAFGLFAFRPDLAEQLPFKPPFQIPAAILPWTPLPEPVPPPEPKVEAEPTPAPDPKHEPKAPEPKPEPKGAKPAAKVK